MKKGGALANRRRLIPKVVRDLYRKPASAFGTSLVLLFIFLALFGPWITAYTPTEQTYTEVLQAPSVCHWFGTDHLGRDLFSRIIHGARSILSLTGLGALLAIVAGTALGLLSGYLGGLFDELVMRVFDSLLAMPALLLALVLLGAVGPSRWSVLAVIAVVYTPIVARVVRSEVLSIKAKAFVEAARLQGERLPGLLFREILPSVLPALSVEAALRFSYGIFLVASLGFLGVGVQPPTPDWGLMVKEERIYFRLAPWSLYFPAGAISLLVIAVNLTADGLKRALRASGESLSPRLRRRVLRTRKGTLGASGPSPAASSDVVLSLDRVTVSYHQGGRWLDAVRDVSLEVHPAESVGLVGESGSGKSTLALAIARYLSTNGAVRAGAIRFGGRNLLELAERELARLRGAEINLVPQDPLASLNPSIRVGEQIAEILRRHTGASRSTARGRTLELLDRVRIADPERVARQYPHQLSGGMRQRVTIAMGLSTEPRLLLFDEPTTGLDVTTEAAILDLIAQLLSSGERSSLYISHDLGVVSRVAMRLAVLYAGEIVEIGSVQEVFPSPRHPYTIGLLRSVPRVAPVAAGAQLPTVEGTIPSLDAIPPGCVFRPRCRWAEDVCAERPLLETIGGGRHVRCHRWETVAEDTRTADRVLSSEETRRAPRLESEAVLTAEALRVEFSSPRSLADVIRRRPRRGVHAVENVDLTIEQGRTVGLVGESGSGKTTFARAVLGLQPRTSGCVTLGEDALPPTLRGRSRTMLQRLQAVSQDPDQALNPYASIGASLARPLRSLAGMGRSEARAAVRTLLERVGLPPSYAARVPGELSGGEKQRIAIARAFAARPELILYDEATSSLDVSVQARILNLLRELQDERGGSSLFITHDLGVVSHLADEIAVMYLGELMEIGTKADVLSPPYHPYTEALLSAFPALGRASGSSAARMTGQIPSPVDRPTGCPFHTRCPRRIGPICADQEPPWRRGDRDHRIYCHIERDELCRLQVPLFETFDRSCGEET